MKRFLSVVALLLSGVFAEVAAAQIHIDTCNQYIPDGETAVLTADLLCAPATTAITIGSGATLNLNGHAIEAPDGWAVWCEPATSCTVVGGGSGGTFGEIRGASSGIYLQRRTRATISSVVIRDCETGINAEDWNAGVKGASASLVNVEITGSDAAAVRVGRLKLSNVTIHDNPGDGIYGSSMSAAKASGLTVVRNATSEGCDYYGCEGINVGVLRGSGLYVADNAGIGIHALQVKLRDSTVVENRRAGSLRGLVVSEAPRLRHVACDTSFGWGSQFSVPWGVCSFDGSN